MNKPPVDAPHPDAMDKLPPQGTEQEVQRLIGEGLDLVSQDRIEAAAEKFNQAIELAPQTLMPYFYLTNIQLELDDQNGAIDTLQRAIDNNATRPEAHAMVGYILSREGVLPEAMDEYATAIDLNPEYAPAYAGMARVNIMENDMAAAGENLQKAMELDSEAPSVQIAEAELAFKMGNKRDAMQQLRDMASDPDMRNTIIRDELRFMFALLGERIPNALK